MVRLAIIIDGFSHKLALQIGIELLAERANFEIFTLNQYFEDRH